MARTLLDQAVDLQRAVAGLVSESVPHLVHNWVMVTPFQFAGGLALLGSIAFAKRRQRVMAETAASKKEEDES